jgi:hypothetical protein
MDRRQIEAYWAARQPDVIRSLDWLTGRQTQRRQPPGPDLSR